jgi:hypothetical protein
MHHAKGFNMNWNPQQMLGRAAGIDLEALQSMIPRLESALDNLACMPELQLRLLATLQNEFGSAVIDRNGNIMGGFDPRADAESEYFIVESGKEKEIDFSRQIVRGHIAIKGSSDGEAIVSFGLRQTDSKVKWLTTNYHLEAGEVFDISQWINVVKVSAIGGIVKVQLFGQGGTS